MKIKRRELILTVTGLAGSFFFIFEDPLKAQDVLPSRTIDVQGLMAPMFVRNWNMADKIEEAKQLLGSSPQLQFEESPQTDKRGRIIKKKGQPVMEMTRKEVALAILDTETGLVFEKRYWLIIAEINRADALRKKYLDNPDYLPRFHPAELGSPTHTDEEFRVISNWWNSFNSDLSVFKEGASDGRYVVVANKYLMSNDDLAYPEDRTGERYSDIVYVPYSDAIADKTVITAGLAFLNEHVRQAFQELAETGVRSKAFPDQLVTDTITQTFVKNVFLTEHTDPKGMINSTDGGRKLAERVFVRLGTNGEKAFRYTVSKTGASGLGQIMPGTYASMFKGYSSAQLIKNTDIGRVDVKNGIKASTLVLDDHLAEVRRRVNNSGNRARQVFSNLTPDELDEVRGMIYNGGAGKYSTTTGKLNLSSRGAKETVGFLQKFRMIRALGLFDQYASSGQ